MKLAAIFNHKPVYLLPLLVIVAVYVSISSLALFDTDHFLKNLEPYPDGLLYALSARNAVMGEGLKLVNNDVELKSWVPQLYSLALIPGYLISNQPEAFYLSNIFLLAATISVIYIGMYFFGRSILVATAVTVLFLSQAVIWWLPSVPMSENLMILSFTLAVMSLIQKPSIPWLSLSLVGILSLFFTKSAVVPLAALLAILLARNLIISKEISQRIKIGLLGLSLFLGGLGIIIISPSSFMSMMLQVINFLKLIAGTGTNYHSLSFIPNNLPFYIGVLLGLPRNLLWLNVANTSVVLASLSIVAAGINLVKGDRKIKQSTIILLLATIGVLPLPLIFYTPDSRHLLTICITYPLIIGMFLRQFLMQSSFWQAHRNFVIGLGLVIILITGISQLSWWRNLLSANVIGRSTGWQYKAITEFNNSLVDGDVIITSLPPVLVDAYQTKNYRTLPLSTHQEFIAKGENLWGSDVGLTNLSDQYRKWLEEGQKLLISNAYITHQQSVIDDYEAYKEVFDFELVAEGCEQACNIYRLKLKEAPLTP